jgi:hypothetical protein
MLYVCSGDRKQRTFKDVSVEGDTPLPSAKSAWSIVKYEGATNALAIPGLDAAINTITQR